MKATMIQAHSEAMKQCTGDLNRFRLYELRNTVTGREFHSFPVRFIKVVTEHFLRKCGVLTEMEHTPITNSKI